MSRASRRPSTRTKNDDGKEEIRATKPELADELAEAYALYDYSARQIELGKSIGDDFREGKITLPVVLAFERGDAEERAFWRRCVEQLEQRDEDLNQALGLMDKHRALEGSK